MRYILGGLALIAAVVIVGCSATTLFLTAFNSVSVPWQQWVAGVTIATVVAWEAVALLVISFCFRKWHWVLGLGTSIALVLAMAVTASMEWKLYLGGRADVSVERSVKADDRDRVRAELDRAYSRRDKLQEMERLTTFQKQELTEVKSRISKLENQWDTRTVMVKASGNVEGEAIQDLLGWDARTTQIIIDTLPMWLMMLLRVISVPGAIIAFQAMRSEKPQESRTAAKASDPISVAPAPVTSVLRDPATPRAPMKVLEKLTGVKAAAPNSALNSVGSAELVQSSAEELGQNTIPSNGLVPKKASEEITPPDGEGTGGNHPDGPGTPIAKPEEPKIEEVADISNVVPLKGYHDSAADWRIEKDVPEKRSKKRAQETSVSRWLRGFDVRDLTPEEVKAGKGFFAKSYLKQYEAWCRAHKENPFKLKKFSAVLRGELDQPKKRRAGGQRFNVALEPVMAQARRRVA